MENWMKKAAEKYPLTEEQMEQKAAIESGDDTPFFTHKGKRYYYDNSTEYVNAVNDLEDALYKNWDVFKIL